MIDVMLCFHIHQPYRLEPVHLPDREADLFDNDMNRSLLEKVSTTCYVPATKTLQSLERRYGKDFKCSFSITGTVVEQLVTHKPAVMEGLRTLCSSPSVELIGETYYHSLFSRFDREEFIEQVKQHSDMMKREFARVPSVFRNTELLYEDSVSDYLSSLDQFRVLLCEDVALGQDNTAAPPMSYNGLHILLGRDHVMTDEVAFRFDGPDSPGHGLTAQSFVSQLAESEKAHVLLYMDYETLGEHHPEKSGIFTFFRDLAEIILNSAHMRFIVPSDAQERLTGQPVSVQRPVTWADSAKDLSAWLSCEIQNNAISAMLELWAAVKRRGDAHLLEMTRRLTSSDHFYYMYPWDGGADAEVHRHFAPYTSPEEAYMRYMAALAVLELKLS
jgi:alpha-amylase